MKEKVTTGNEHETQKMIERRTSFRTAPEWRRSKPVRFVWGGDVGQGLANRPPFPAFGSMSAERPDFFIFWGACTS